ncbi:Asp23/Gls24 family envelope stress response protein [Butyricicoccus pullicaecorum]|uniref:Asp23/Gls24 family envelope stress response protein n=1 Tax=Butyricicoccus pullicaecorum TaxID=501571 RepID=A0A1Y4LCL4_9FIRM|nr:Asp23/Gls24 family envelope stress response protein [Butyricicoccus pullicaecorum]OUP52561.1 Asp23/Gls24 family envelope stress response protein [Butyricicoccus pullicaecorum]
MAEHKDYWVTAGDQGTIKISEDVVASIAALAAAETEGVGGLAAGLTAEIASLLGKKSQNKGVRVQLGEQDTVGVELSILVEFGKSVGEVALAVQKAVKAAVESMTGLKTAVVNVVVSGVTFDQPKPAEETLAPVEP